MLPKPNRLPSYEIPHVLKHGKRITEGSLVIVYQKNSLEHSRFAFVVPTSVDKRATVRNRMKRLLREAVQSLLGQITGGLDMVTMVRRDISGLRLPKVQDLLKTILVQARH